MDKNREILKSWKGKTENTSYKIKIRLEKKEIHAIIPMYHSNLDELYLINKSGRTR